MPSRPRKTPAPVTTGAARRTEEPDALAAAPPTPRAAKPKPAATPAAGTRKVATRTPRKAAAVAPTPPAAPAPIVEEILEAPASGRKIQRSFHVDIDVLDNARAAVTYLAAYVPEAGVQSLSDLVNPGLFQMTKVLQDKYNNGQPFRRVARMQAGRPPKRT